MMKKRILLLTALLLIFFSMEGKSRYVYIEGENLIQPNGEKLRIKGTNLGNWMNPEGYMFGFTKCNSGWMISEMLSELVGPDEAAAFWEQFKENYITEADIRFMAGQGVNTVRIPFNYKLFTLEDYMGMNDDGEGFRLIDRVMAWCQKYKIYVILDMHDCPGGQTGDNIDNSYGYPWFFTSMKSQQLFFDIWERIAAHYKDNPSVLGYELMNEPIAPYFGADVARFNNQLEELYKKAVAAIRRVDRNHIILLGGSQWNGNFEPFKDWTFDHKIMYTCHRYGGSADQEAFQEIIDFRDKTGLPMYMGETGHNSDQWQSNLCEMLTENNIGYTFWPYKKVDGSSFVAVERPAGWDSVIVRFAEADRSTFKAIREARPDQSRARLVLKAYLRNILFENCKPQAGYIRSMRLK